jgi:mono/diheme cytochrome c family protein
LRFGIRPDGYTLSYPMVPMPELDDRDLASIYAYLRSVPPVRHAVERASRPLPDTDPGKAAYARYGCASCHGESGLGIADLRAANRDYPKDDALLHWILDAPALKPGTRMPAWRGIIDEKDYPALLAHVRKLSANGDSSQETRSTPTLEGEKI